MNKNSVKIVKIQKSFFQESTHHHFNLDNHGDTINISNYLSYKLADSLIQIKITVSKFDLGSEDQTTSHNIKVYVINWKLLRKNYANNK